MKKTSLANLILITTSLGICLFLVFTHPLKEQIASFFSTQKLRQELVSQLRFDDITQKAGLVYDHALNLPFAPTPETAIFPSVLIYDFDNNGFPDIFFSGGKRNYLYLNLGNEHFAESAARFGLSGNEHQNVINSQALMADINQDGTDDLFLATNNGHRLFIKYKTSDIYKDVSSKLGGYSSFSHDLNFIDFNQDGLLDIVVANFFNPKKQYRNYQSFTQDKYSPSRGAMSAILIQNSNGTFSEQANIHFDYSAYTNAVGISDVNGDGYPDILLANDYGRDHLYLNDSGKQLQFVTLKLIDKDPSLFGGKNVEFADYNNDGLIDIFITNTYAPPYQNGYNLLWKKISSSGKFQLQAPDSNIGKCGMSWAAKFADFNLDGQLDLFMVNGHKRSLPNSHIKSTHSALFKKAEISLFPSFLMKHSDHITRPESSIENSLAFERDCLFIQDHNKFYDVAEMVGLTDTQEGRGMALVDLNNDGLMDIVVTNYFGQSKVYLNRSSPSNSWIGFVLYNKNGSKIPIGARITLKQSNGPDLVREYYPANGFRGQSDYRLLFGLSKDSRPLKLIVKWPNGKEITYSTFSEKKYNDIFERE